jgi:hypothetical protein
MATSSQQAARPISVTKIANNVVQAEAPGRWKTNNSFLIGVIKDRTAKASVVALALSLVASDQLLPVRINLAVS